MCGCKAPEKKGDWKKAHQKVRMPITLVKGNYFGTPLYTMCQINKGDDKRQGLRTGGGAGGGGGGGADTRRKGLKEEFM